MNKAEKRYYYATRLVKVLLETLGVLATVTTSAPGILLSVRFPEAHQTCTDKVPRQVLPTHPTVYVCPYVIHIPVECRPVYESDFTTGGLNTPLNSTESPEPCFTYPSAALDHHSVGQQNP